MKIFELIGATIGAACLIQIASAPSAALNDIRKGPVPNLVRLNDALTATRNTVQGIGVCPVKRAGLDCERRLKPLNRQ